jgi:lipid-A-disaccharide synthase-like uncharacterized protein
MIEFLEAMKNPVVLIGFAGQLAFLGRFVVQWLASERARRSVIPRSFWYLSISGALLLLVYSFLRKDPVFLIGQGAAMAIYIRNLVLLRREASSAPS